jgi:hypothetical protein
MICRKQAYFIATNLGNIVCRKRAYFISSHKPYSIFLKNLLNFRLSLSSWGPIKVGAWGNLSPPPPSRWPCMQSGVTCIIHFRHRCLFLASEHFSEYIFISVSPEKLAFSLTLPNATGFLLVLLW